MRWKTVQSYSLSWRADRGVGVVGIHCQDDTTGRIEVASIQDLEAFGSLMRNEGPIYYSPEMNALRTGPEPPGEEESSNF